MTGKPLTAEVVSIGDELTSGQRLDTNSQWLSTQLAELGVSVAFHTTVADDLPSNVRVFREAISRADVVVASGGLGPTADDLTREALAAAVNVELELDEASLAHIRGLFAARGRKMPQRNVVQAKFPRGSRPVFNPHGSAPGIDMEILRASLDPNAGGICHFFCLPGVPAELREMWPRVAGQLQQRGVTRGVIRHRRLKCFGVGESDLEQMLPDLIRRGRQPSVGITVSQATITLRISAAGASEVECFASMQETEATIRQCLGPLVFGEEDDELQHAAARLLAQQERTLSIVEWGTGGIIGNWLAEVPAAVGPFLGAWTVGNLDAAARLLSASSLADAAPHSRQMAESLAAACRDRWQSDYALAVAAFPPGNETDEVETDESRRVFFALATPENITTQSIRLNAHPSIVKVRAAKAALDFVRRTLEDG